MRRLGNQGFSLVQVLISAGLMSLLFLAANQIVKNQIKVSKSSSEAFEITYVVDDIRRVLSNRINCKHTFQNLNIRTGKIQSISVVNKNNQKKNAYTSDRSGQHLYGQDNIKIVEMGFIDEDSEFSADSRSGIFEIEFEKLNSLYGSKKVKRRILIHTQTDKNLNIQSCFTVGNSHHLNSSLAEEWAGIPSSSNIYLPKGSLTIGGALNRSRVNVKGAISVGFIKGTKKCDTNQIGSLRFNQKSKIFEACYKERLWVPLIGKEELKLSLPTLEIVSTTSSKTKESLRLYHLCHIAGKLEKAGACSVTRNNVRSSAISQSKTRWIFTAESDQGQEVICNFKCYNR